MKKDLPYFTIAGAYGGSQDWFTNVVMYIGGCGAATACDSCIYFSLYEGLKELYPFDIYNLSKEDYKRFSQIMKPYIKPRKGGVKKLEWYIEGLERYVRYVNESKGSSISIKMEGFSGNHSFEDAKRVIQDQIDNGKPVPYLMLKHTEYKFKDFAWHWFLLTGYEETEEDFYIQAATYGEATRMSLKELWNTGYEEKGGIILYK